MMEAGQARRESHPKGVTDTIAQKAFPLPAKIAVMTDGWYARFGNEFSQGETKWNMQRNRKGIFNDQQFEVIFLDELIQTILEVGPQFMDAMCDLRWTGRRSV